MMVREASVAEASVAEGNHAVGKGLMHLLRLLPPACGGRWRLLVELGLLLLRRQLRLLRRLLLLLLLRLLQLRLLLSCGVTPR